MLETTMTEEIMATFTHENDVGPESNTNLVPAPCRYTYMICGRLVSVRWVCAAVWSSSVPQ